MNTERRNMFDVKKFGAAVQRSGLKKRYIADQAGISYDTFLKKMSGTVKWKTDEAQEVSKPLRISRAERDGIFFA